MPRRLPSWAPPSRRCSSSFPRSVFSSAGSSRGTGAAPGSSSGSRACLGAPSSASSRSAKPTAPLSTSTPNPLLRRPHACYRSDRLCRPPTFPQIHPTHHPLNPLTLPTYPPHHLLHPQEALVGVSTIRAFRDEGRFVALHEKALDGNLRAYLLLQARACDVVYIYTAAWQAAAAWQRGSPLSPVPPVCCERRTRSQQRHFA